MSDPLAEQSRLQSGAIGLGSVLMQAITHMAPAILILFTVQFAVGQAGTAAPMTYFVGGIVIFALGVTLGELAKAYPSAGGYYTYVSSSVGPRSGFVIAWLFTLYSPLVAAFNYPYFGYVLDQTLRDHFSIGIPWWAFVVAATAIVFALTRRGITLSARTMTVAGLLEIGIVLALAIWGLADPGPGGVPTGSLNPTNAPSSGGFYLAALFAIFAFTGWEAAAPLAEESRDPRRVIPRSILLSIVALVSFAMFSSWGLMAGWGSAAMPAFADASVNPAITLAGKYWGEVGWVVVLLALLNSMLAVGLASATVSTRMWYSMSRSGTIPKAFARIDRSTATPINAVYLQTALTAAVGLAAGIILGADQTFFFFGVLVTFALIPIYSAGNVAAFRTYYRTSEFKLLRHAGFPLLSTVALLWLGYKSLVPLPAHPYDWAPLVVLIWVGIGLAVVAMVPRTVARVALRDPRSQQGDLDGAMTTVVGPVFREPIELDISADQRLSEAERLEAIQRLDEFQQGLTDLESRVTDVDLETGERPS